MGKQATAEQIAGEILSLEAMKGRIPARSAFGDDNLAAIRAQIEVLRRGLDEEEVEVLYGDGDEGVLISALFVARWMAGRCMEDDAESPTADWVDLVDVEVEPLQPRE